MRSFECSTVSEGVKASNFRLRRAKASCCASRRTLRQRGTCTHLQASVCRKSVLARNEFLPQGFALFLLLRLNKKMRTLTGSHFSAVAGRVTSRLNSLYSFESGCCVFEGYLFDFLTAFCIEVDIGMDNKFRTPTSTKGSEDPTSRRWTTALCSARR